MYSNGSRQSTVMGPDEHGNEPSGSIRSEEFLDKLSNYQFLKKRTVFRGVSY